MRTPQPATTAHVLALILRSAWTWPRSASPATLAASLDSEPFRTPQQA